MAIHENVRPVMQSWGGVGCVGSSHGSAGTAAVFGHVCGAATLWWTAICLKRSPCLVDVAWHGSAIWVLDLGLSAGLLSFMVTVNCLGKID